MVRILSVLQMRIVEQLAFRHSVSFVLVCFQICVWGVHECVFMCVCARVCVFLPYKLHGMDDVNREHQRYCMNEGCLVIVLAKAIISCLFLLHT